MDCPPLLGESGSLGAGGLLGNSLPQPTLTGKPDSCHAAPAPPPSRGPQPLTLLLGSRRSQRLCKAPLPPPPKDLSQPKGEMAKGQRSWDEKKDACVGVPRDFPSRAGFALNRHFMKWALPGRVPVPLPGASGTVSGRNARRRPRPYLLCPGGLCWPEGGTSSWARVPDVFLRTVKWSHLVFCFFGRDNRVLKVVFK